MFCNRRFANFRNHSFRMPEDVPLISSPHQAVSRVFSLASVSLAIATRSRALWLPAGRCELPCALLLEVIIRTYRSEVKEIQAVAEGERTNAEGRMGVLGA